MLIIYSINTKFSVISKLIKQILIPYTECSTLSINEHMSNLVCYFKTGFLFISLFSIQ